MVELAMLAMRQWAAVRAYLGVAQQRVKRSWNYDDGSAYLKKTILASV
jgi:hypothetical protein